MTIQKISTLAGAALLAGGLLAGAVAQAQPDPYHRDDRRPPPPVVRPDHRPPPPVIRPGYRPLPRPPVVIAPPPPIAVGRPLPYDYRGYNYRVDNWNYYHLPRPHRGQYWVQYGAQFLLINPAGLVLQVFVP